MRSLQEKLARSVVRALLGMGCVLATGVHAQNSTGGATPSAWQDTTLTWRYGADFAEPYNKRDLHKNIYNLTHRRGNEWGRQQFSVSLLKSDQDDAYDRGSSRGAEEWYGIYRYTLDLGHLVQQDLAFGPVKRVGATVGLDANRKHDIGYNSRKRMWVAGATLDFAVPGVLQVSLLQAWESNSPYNRVTGVSVPRYDYKPHPILSVAWGFPLGDSGWSFAGLGNYIAAKGRNEFGGPTRPETNIDAALMYDLGRRIGLAPQSFKAGLAYQYWRNKMGNDHEGPAGDGAFARTPMLRAEYRF